MDIVIKPSKLNGNISAIPSKSDFHRILICSAFCKTPVTINASGENLSNDIKATINCVHAMGADVITSSDSIKVVPNQSAKKISPLLDCGESGSTLRFLLPVAAALGINARFVGCGRLPLRPLSPLKEQLEAHGVTFSGAVLPFSISGKLTQGKYYLSGDVSSQYVSGLLFALSLLKKGSVSEIILTSPLQSKPYADMTVNAIKRFGGDIKTNDNKYVVTAVERFSFDSQSITPEGDWSNSSFWVVAAAIGGKIKIDNLSFDFIQGDKAIANVASSFGATVSLNEKVLDVCHSELTSTEIDATNIPDAVIPIAVMASVAKGTTTISGIKRLRIKESDRVISTCNMINSLGGHAFAYENCIVITGDSGLKGGIVDGCNDHRIVMAATIASCCSSGNILIHGAEAINKSYPDFFKDFKMLGGKYDVINDR